MDSLDDHIIIQNIEKYDINFKNGNLILKKKVKYQNNIFNNDFKNSKIINCFVENKELDIIKYKPLLENIYFYINNREIIKDNTILNIEDGCLTDKGFKFIEELNFSVQGADSNKTLKEIVNISNICNIKLKFNIKLENDKIVEYTNY